VSPIAIQATGLRKRYGPQVVLDGIDLEVPAGTVFALLGPNGAGKTTTVDILATLTPADAGEARIGGHSVAGAPDEVRRLIGLTSQSSAIDLLLTGRENLMLMADLHHLPRRERRPRVTRLLEQFDLVNAADRATLTWSGGMKRRLDLAMTLLGEPRVLFLDEPTTGLDPRSRRAVWRLVRELVAGGVTVLLTTQYLDEADELADTIAVLDHGRLVAQGSPDELKRRVSGGHVRLEFADEAALSAAIAKLPDFGRDANALAVRRPIDGSVRALRDLLDRVDAAALDVRQVTVNAPDLDDVFLALTDREPAQ
jgi:ABC-2 type transport system ATP-binding protein